MIEPEKDDDVSKVIRAAVLARKDGAELEKPFILPWRMHADQHAWRTQGLTSCGCGFCPDDPPSI